MSASRMLAASALLLAATVQAQAPVPATPPPPVPYGAAIPLAEARRCGEAARVEAARNSWLMVVTVVDPGGHVVLTERMDNAQFGSVAPALAKARTAAGFRRSTKFFEDMVAAGGAGLRVMEIPDVIPIEGGLPLIHEGKLIGAVGTSGGSAQQDGVVAAACVKALEGG